MAELDLTSEKLAGAYVRLEPYCPALERDVRAALDCDADAWELFTNSGQGENFDGWWRTHMAEMESGSRLSFAVRRLSDGAVVGSTSYLNIRRKDRGAEIGSTFYRPDARGGAVNPECKLLLLQHGFDCGALRMELVTDLRNLRSQAAIAKLGAVREGVLRKHKVTWTGHIRDTVMYSITDAEWPAVRSGLQRRLAAFA